MWVRHLSLRLLKAMGNRIPGVNAQGNPYSLLCELGHKGAPAWAALLNWADLGSVCFSNSANQNLCPRGQVGKERITFCQMIDSSFLKSNTGSSPGTQKLMKFLPCITSRLLESERVGNNRTLGILMLLKKSNPKTSFCQCPGSGASLKMY